LLHLDILLYYRFILENLCLEVASIENFAIVFIKDIRVEKLVHDLGCNRYILNVIRADKR